MILLTGGTGFISSVMRKQLETLGIPYRLLISTEPKSEYITPGERVNIAVSSPYDERGLRAAMKDVEIVFHTSGVEQIAAKDKKLENEFKEIELLAKVSRETGINRFYYLSHIGADRASAFGIMKAKGIAEHTVINSGLNYTILRTGLVYGEGDAFTQNIVRLIRKFPLMIFVPGDGKMLTQPIWVDDLVTSMIWSLDLPETLNRVIEIGGPEHLTFTDIVETISNAIQKNPKTVGITPSNLAILTQLMQGLSKDFPMNKLWLDYLAENRVTSLDSMPRHFGINPARFAQQLDYLKKEKKR